MSELLPHSEAQKGVEAYVNLEHQGYHPTVLAVLQPPEDRTQALFVHSTRAARACEYGWNYPQASMDIHNGAAESFEAALRRRFDEELNVHIEKYAQSTMRYLGHCALKTEQVTFQCEKHPQGKSYFMFQLDVDADRLSQDIEPDINTISAASFLSLDVINEEVRWAAEGRPEAFANRQKKLASVMNGLRRLFEIE